MRLLLLLFLLRLLLLLLLVVVLVLFLNLAMMVIYVALVLLMFRQQLLQLSDLVRRKLGILLVLCRFRALHRLFFFLNYQVVVAVVVFSKGAMNLDDRLPFLMTFLRSEMTSLRYRLSSSQLMLPLQTYEQHN